MALPTTYNGRQVRSKGYYDRALNSRRLYKLIDRETGDILARASESGRIVESSPRPEDNQRTDVVDSQGNVVNFYRHDPQNPTHQPPGNARGNNQWFIINGKWKQLSPGSGRKGYNMEIGGERRKFTVMTPEYRTRAEEERLKKIAKKEKTTIASIRAREQRLARERQQTQVAGMTQSLGSEFHGRHTPTPRQNTDVQNRSGEILRNLEAQGAPRNENERLYREQLRREAQGNIDYATTAGSGRVHTVVSGDTLSAIARRNGMSVQELQRLNPSITDPNRINVGQRITIGGGQSSQSATTPSRTSPRDRGEFMFSNPRTDTQTPTETRGRGGSTPRMSPGLRDGAQGPYTVVQGDNLTRIARRHGMGLQDLLALNPEITNPNMIQIGQRINVGQAGGGDRGVPEPDFYRGNEFGLQNPNSGIPIDTSGLGDAREYRRDLQNIRDVRADEVAGRRRVGTNPDTGRRTSQLNYQRGGGYDSDFHGRYTPSTGQTNYTERPMAPMHPNTHRDYPEFMFEYPEQETQGGNVPVAGRPNLGMRGQGLPSLDAPSEGGATTQPGPAQPQPQQPQTVAPVPGGGGTTPTAPTWDPNIAPLGTDVGGVSPVATQQSAVDAYLQNAMQALQQSRDGVDAVYSRRDIEASDLFRLIGPRPDLSKVIRDLQALNPTVPTAVGSRDFVKQQSELDGASRDVQGIVETDNGANFSNAVRKQKNEDLSGVMGMPSSFFGNKHIQQSYARVLDLYEELDAFKDASKDVRRWVKERGKGDISLGLLNAFTLNKSREVNDRIAQLQRQIDSANRVLTIQTKLQDRQDALRREEREWQYRMSRDARRDYEADRGFAMDVYDRDTRAYEADRAFAFGLDRENARRFESDRAFAEGRMGRAEDNLYRALGLSERRRESDRDFLTNRQDEAYRRQFDLYRQRRGEHEFDRSAGQRDRQLAISGYGAETSRMNAQRLAGGGGTGGTGGTGGSTVPTTASQRNTAAKLEQYRNTARSYGASGLGQHYTNQFERLVDAGELEWSDLESFAAQLGVDLNVDTGFLHWGGQDVGSDEYNEKVQAIGNKMYELATGSEGDIGRLGSLLRSYGLQ